ncbi:MAG TPA: XrtA system polysaccharide chain length determinant [Candidatus Acidoferrales bacterium]|nr:XrtA system polysaccharide chain length determinant [Candidatus Acidoferrales bacterium]
MLDEEEGQVYRSLDEYWTIVWRRRWYIVLPVFACWAIAWAGSWVVPSTFQSEALILVEQQKVPEQYVVPNVTVNLQDRLQSMTEQILSRTRLQATINRFHLYGTRRRWDFIQAADPVDQMRKDIKIDLVEAPDRPGQLTAFKIRYSAGTPQLARQVNSELTTLFIDENLEAQQQLSESTTAFLESQLADASAKLQEQEAKVRAFKASHFGDLPSQMETNVQILAGLQNQLQATQRDLDGANQQKLYLESLLQEYQSIEASLGNGGATATTPDTFNKDLSDLRRQLEEARLRYTEDYPDVVQLKDKISKMEKLKKDVDSEIAANPKPTTPTSGADPGSAAEVEHGAPSSMMQVQSQLKANRLEIQNYQQQVKKIETQITDYQARLNLTPATEQELADISRGYEESKANYDSLLQKQNQSQLATSLEERQQGEQFRILDPPSLPTRPSSPNHLLISLAGLLVGFTAGAVLTAFLEITNVRVRQEKDLEEAVSLRVLIGIPHLDAPGEGRTRSLFRRLELGALVIMVILVVVGNLYAFYKS